MTTPSTKAPSDQRPGDTRRILYCHCAYARVVPAAVKAEVLDGLARSGVAFDAVPDLCELAARHDPALERLAGERDTDEQVEIIACYPRAVKWLFHAADAPLPENGVTIHNMRTTEAHTVLADVLGDGTLADAANAVEPPTENDE